MNYLGIDYGLKHVGIAISTGPISQPLTTLENSPGLIDKLCLLITSHKIEGVVVGLPENQMGEKVKEFIDVLGKSTSIPIFLQDETLSSLDATQSLQHRGKIARKSLVHQAAAALILQSWLDSKTS